MMNSRSDAEGHGRPPLAATCNYTKWNCRYICIILRNSPEEKKYNNIYIFIQNNLNQSTLRFSFPFFFSPRLPHHSDSVIADAHPTPPPSVTHTQSDLKTDPKSYNNSFQNWVSQKIWHKKKKRKWWSGEHHHQVFFLPHSCAADVEDGGADHMKSTRAGKRAAELSGAPESISACSLSPGHYLLSIVWRLKAAAASSLIGSSPAALCLSSPWQWAHERKEQMPSGSLRVTRERCCSH